MLILFTYQILFALEFLILWHLITNALLIIIIPFQS